MLKCRVIPCLDVKDGRVVKGVHFVDLRDAGDPVQCAIAYDAAGADELCFLDITASHENRAIILDVVQRTAEACFMPLTAGGGVRTLDDIRALLLAGADKVSINDRRRRQPRDRPRGGAANSAANVSWWRSTPSKPHPGTWEIFTHGGRKPTGLDALAYAQEVVALGAGEILLTSMDRDGTKSGFDLALTRAVTSAVPVPVIASGGVGTLDHLVEGIRDGGASAVLAASIFHFGEFTIAEAKDHMARARPAGAARRESRRRPLPSRARTACQPAWGARHDTASPSMISPRLLPRALSRAPRHPIPNRFSTRAQPAPPRNSARRRSRS